MLRRRLVLLLLAGLIIFNPCTPIAADQEAGISKEYIKWSTVKGKECENLNSVAYGSGRFVAVGSGGVIRASEDGRNGERSIGGAVKIYIKSFITAASLLQ